MSDPLELGYCERHKCTLSVEACAKRRERARELEQDGRRAPGYRIASKVDYESCLECDGLKVDERLDPLVARARELNEKAEAALERIGRVVRSEPEPVVFVVEQEDEVSDPKSIDSPPDPPRRPNKSLESTPKAKAEYNFGSRRSYTSAKQRKAAAKAIASGVATVGHFVMKYGVAVSTVLKWLSTEQLEQLTGAVFDDPDTALVVKAEEARLERKASSTVGQIVWRTCAICSGSKEWKGRRCAACGGHGSVLVIDE